MLSSNQVLHEGRYRIIHQFGQEESGSLYEAYDTVSNTKVVLRESSGATGKVATPAQLETARSAFAEDAKRLTEIEHPALLKVKDYFSEIDRQYLVMETCDGSDLEELLKDDDKIPAVSDVLRWTDQLLDVLDYLHSRQPSIIHRNINPRNIRLTSSYKVKLLANGFGTGGNDEPDVAEDSSESADLGYRALEQLWLGLDSASQKVIANSFDARSEEVLRQPADARTDIYSVGATLYYLLTRTVPADALARTLDILDGNDDPLQTPNAIDASIPADVSEAIMKAMKLKREERFESATIMRQVLSSASASLKQSPIGKKPEAPKADVQAPSAEREGHENDRLKFERERQELDAEQKRLDEERNRIEQKRLVFEAEEKRRAEEAAKQAREAEERQKAEQFAKEAQEAEEKRKAELLAKEAREAEERRKAEWLLEEKRRAEAAKLEAERAAAANKKPAGAEKSELDKNDLLDLPEPGAVTVPPVSMHADVLALDADSVRHKPKVSDYDGDIFSEPEKGPGLFKKPAVLVAAATGLMVVVIGIWFMMGSNSSSVTPAASVKSATVSDTSKSDSLPQQTSDTDPTSSTSTPQTLGSPDAPAVSAQVEVKAQSEAAKEKIKKQPTPQPKPTVEKKKAVTVDDLINDN